MIVHNKRERLCVIAVWRSYVCVCAPRHILCRLVPDTANTTKAKWNEKKMEHTTQPVHRCTCKPNVSLAHEKVSLFIKVLTLCRCRRRNHCAIQDRLANKLGELKQWQSTYHTPATKLHIIENHRIVIFFSSSLFCATRVTTENIFVTSFVHHQNIH